MEPPPSCSRPFSICVVTSAYIDFKHVVSQMDPPAGSTSQLRPAHLPFSASLSPTARPTSASSDEKRGWSETGPGLKRPGTCKYITYERSYERGSWPYYSERSDADGAKLASLRGRKQEDATSRGCMPADLGGVGTFIDTKMGNTCPLAPLVGMSSPDVCSKRFLWELASAIL